jgi:hypothetical protein
VADDFVQVAPDSTGAKIRTRARTIGANAIEEQYVIVQQERVVSARAYTATFRTPSRAVSAQPVFVLWNGGTNPVSVRRLTMEYDSGASFTALTVTARLYRITAAPTGGTVLAKGQQDTNETTGVNIVATGDASADGTSSTTALAATANPTTHLWQQTMPRFSAAAAAGTPPSAWQVPAVLNLLPDDSTLLQEDPFVLRGSQGLMVRIDAPAAMVAGTTTAGHMFYVKCAFGEFTLP